MRLSFFGGSRTSGVAHLADVFESQEDAWAFVEDDDGWFRPGEAIHIRHRRLGDRGVIAVGEVEGNLVVDELLTENARIAIDAEPLRTIAASGDPRLFRSALRVVRALSHALAPLEPAPSHDEALAGQHELHDAQEVVEDARDSTGLSELEEILVERWMRADADVLDIGCGTGREALAFAARGMRVTAIDVSHRSVEVARTRAAREFPGDQVHALAGDLTTLQLPYESFDVIFFASDVFASIPRADNRVRILRQAVDLLRPGGRVFVQAIITPHRIRAALLDVARAAMAELRGTPHERGDRWIWKGPPPIRMFRHGFASDEAVVDELERSGLSFVARCGSY
ncbi:MAG: class I SAM-dependent methyltransferase, partial [Polyangiaceae bacterium]